MPRNSVYCFGDSWAHGSELKKKEKPFPYWYAVETGNRMFNVSAPGNSTGVILKKIEEYLPRIKETDTVLVIIPPDVRWYSQRHGAGFYSIGFGNNEEEYFKFLEQKTAVWFEYHSLLFIYTIQNLLQSKGCKFLLAHNYGHLPSFDKFNFPIDESIFLSKNSLTHILSNNSVEDEWKNFEEVGVNDGPIPEMFSGKYFEGNETHPNELGHKKIAEMFRERLGE